MNMATKLGGTASRIALGASLLVALALALPAAASAEQNCVGHVARLAPTDDDTFPVEYKFLCYEPIKGFVLASSKEMTGFNITADVFGTDGVISGTDRFAECEGELPGLGFTCAGTYTAGNKLITSTFAMSEDPCVLPRPSTWIAVEAATTAAKLSGPFDLGRPRGCPKATKKTDKVAKKKSTKKSSKR